jgi:hypothetical protein
MIAQMLLTSLPVAFFLFGLGGGLIGLLITIFWIWMLIDCLTNASIRGTEKIVWVLVIVLTNFIGAVLYYFLARSGGSRVL